MNIHDLPPSKLHGLTALEGPEEMVRLVRAWTKPEHHRARAHGALPVAQQSLPDGCRRGIQTFVAYSSQQIAAARQLVRARYAWRGYGMPCGDTEPFPDSNRADKYVTLLASEEGAVVGTLTLGIDSSAGLLVDAANREEIDLVRAADRRVSELVQLAVAAGVDSKRVLSSLFQLAYSVGRGIFELTDVFIEVNPRHVAYYQRFFGFVTAAVERTCERVSAPSVLMRLEIADLQCRMMTGVGC